MSLSPPVSIGTGLAVATLVYAIHANATPTLADIRSVDAHNQDIAGASRSADWLAAGVVAGVSLISKDGTVFVIGGIMVIGMAWLERHANAVHPDTGKATSAVVNMGGDLPRVTQASDPSAYAAAGAGGGGYDPIL